ncbi:MAG: hypothetical protein HYY01_04105 [Chloroflexi bacterium]|nr:hypothetical protein [Chloroflexota bacterium]
MIGVAIQQEARDIVRAMGCREMDNKDWASYFMARMDRLVAIRDNYASHLDPGMARILHRAIFSTYLDLRDLGLGQVALDRIRSGPGSLVGVGEPQD